MLSHRNQQFNFKSNSIHYYFFNFFLYYRERLMQGTSAGTVFHRMFRLDCQSKSGLFFQFKFNFLVLN